MSVKKILLILAGMAIGAGGYYLAGRLLSEKPSILEIKAKAADGAQFTILYETCGKIIWPSRHGEYIVPEDKKMKFLAALELYFPLGGNEVRDSSSQFETTMNLSGRWLLYESSDSLYLRQDYNNAQWINVPASRGVNSLARVFKGKNINRKKNAHSVILEGADYLAALSTIPRRLLIL